MNLNLLKYFRVAWKQGMYLTPQIFQQTDDYVDELIRDVRQQIITTESYGLLPNSKLSLQVKSGVQPRSICIWVESCHAVLPDGHRVEIYPEMKREQILLDYPQIEFIPESGEVYSIYICVNLDKMLQEGVSMEYPIRNIYAMPSINLEILKKREIIYGFAPNRMKLAEWQNGDFIPYLPATLCLLGYKELFKYHSDFYMLLSNISDIGVGITKNARAVDAAAVSFCQPILQKIASQWGYYNWILPHNTPLNWISYFGDLAGLVKHLVVCSNLQDKSKSLGLLQQHCDNLLSIRPTGLLENLLQPIELIGLFLETLYQVFKSFIRIEESKKWLNGQENYRSSFGNQGLTLNKKQ